MTGETRPQATISTWHDIRFARIPTDLVRDPNISPVAKALFALIDSYADGNGNNAFPGRAALARDLSRSKRTVDNGIDELEAAGWLVRYRNYDAERKQYAPTLYHLRGSPVEPSDGVGEYVAPGVGEYVAPGVGEYVAPPSVTSCDITKTNTNNPLPINTPASTDVDDGFDRFWDAYGKKVDKGHARKAWKRAVKKTSPETIIAAAEEYRAWVDRNETEQRFVAYPATWLNGERWNDEMVDHRELTVSEQLKLREKENS